MDTQLPGNGIPPEGSGLPPGGDGLPPAGGTPPNGDLPGGGFPGGGPAATPPRPRMNSLTVLLALVLLAVIAFIFFGQYTGGRSEISYTFFRQQLAASNIAEVEQDQQVLTGRFKIAPPIPKAAQTVALGVEPADLDSTGISESKRDFEDETEDSDATDAQDSASNQVDAKPVDAPKPPVVKSPVAKSPDAKPAIPQRKSSDSKTAGAKSKAAKPISSVALSVANPEVPGSDKASGDPAAKSAAAKSAAVERYSIDFKVILPTAELDDKALVEEMTKQGVVIHSRVPSENSGMFLFIYLILPILLIGGLWWFMFRRTRDQFMGGGILSGFSKSPAKRYEDTARSRSRSPTWPAWKASSTICKKSSSS